MRPLNVLFSLFSLLACGFAQTTWATNLVQNPSFEVGDAGWSFTGSAGVDTHDSWAARTGSLEAYVNSFSPAEGTISQNIATELNQRYLVEVWIAQNGSASGHVTVTFGGVGVSDFNVGNPNLPVAPQYMMVSATVTAISTLTPLVFAAAGVNQTIFFEDASVAAVPELGSGAMLLIGLAAIGALPRSRQRFLDACIDLALEKRIPC